MKKLGFLLAAATSIVATGLIALYVLLVILAESAWGPLATPLNRFAVVGMTGVIYFMLTWFTFSILKAATDMNKSPERNALRGFDSLCIEGVTSPFPYHPFLPCQA